jgi:hypothetical protein
MRLPTALAIPGRAGAIAVILGWVGIGGLAIALAPRAQPPAALPKEPSFDGSAAAPAEPVPFDPVATELVELLFPTPLLLGAPLPLLDDGAQGERLIAWLKTTEATLARSQDAATLQARRALVRWVGELLTRQHGFSGRELGASLDDESIAVGWQTWASRHRWPLVISCYVSRLWLAGTWAPPFELALDDGAGRLAARTVLAAASAQPLAGWTRVTLPSQAIELHPVRPGLSARLWLIARGAHGMRALGAIELAGVVGGGTSELIAPGGGVAGVVELRWQREERR